MSRRNPFTVPGKKGRLSHRRFKKEPKSKAPAYIPPKVYIQEIPLGHSPAGAPIYAPSSED